MKIKIHNPGNLPTIDYRTIKPLQGNLKDFHKDEYEKLGNSFSEFGFRFPFFIWFDSDKTPWTIDGHGRLRYFTNENVTNQDGGYEFPYVSIEAKDKIEAKKLLLVATSQYQKITQEGLDEFSFDLPDNFISDFTHFDGVFEYPEDEEEPEAKEDDFEESVPENPVTVLGDLYELHSLDFGLVHRVQCGDSTNEDVVKKTMNRRFCDMILTDPPYNVASDSRNFASDASKAMNELSRSEWDKGFSVGPFLKTITSVFSENITIYVWTSHFLFSQYLNEFPGYVDFISYLVWAKPNPMPSLSKRHPTFNTELCIYATKGSKRIVNFPHGKHFLSCRGDIKKSDGTHPTQKPISLFSDLINFSSKKGSVIYDAFLGSGTTLIAAEQLERNCYGQELDEKYMDVIVRRWTKYMIENNRKFLIKKNGKKLQGEELSVFLPIVNV